MYRLALEWVRSLLVEGGGLTLDPSIPPSWPRFDITERLGSTRYDIVVENSLCVAAES